MNFHTRARLPLRQGLPLWVLALFTIVTLTPLPASAADEFRGVWVDAWGTGFLNASQTTQLIADARAYNFNAIVVQMRRRGDALYAPLTGNDPKSTAVTSSYDALADLIAKAHSGSPRIEVHCWVTTQVIWSSLTPPSQAGHVFNTHPEYLMKDYDGTNYIGEGYYLDPGHPEAARWNYTMATNIVHKYDIDGFHWDYIRYPAPDAGYNDTAIARYNAEFGLTGKPSYTGAQFSTWRRRQVTDFLRWANADMLGLKPNLIISAAVFGSRSDAYNARFQDWAAWNREGILDLCLPMTYSDVNSTYTTRVDDAFNNQGVRRVYPGPGAYLNTKENTVWQLNYARSKPLLGTCLYSYRVPNSGTLDRPGTLAYIRDNYQPAWAATPALPWKTSPSKGLVKGYVKRFDSGAVVYNATVNLFSSPQKSILSEAHGHFAFFEAPIGTFMLAASAPGMGSVTNMVTVTAGGVIHQDLVLPAVDNTPPIITSVSASNVTSATATIVYNTDEQANTAVDFGLTAAYGNVASNATPTMAHSIVLSSLNPASTYHYRVRSRNSSGLTSTSSDYTFTTLPLGAYSDVIVESKLPDGSVMGNPPYQESTVWSTSSAKSTAAGLTGSGSRYAGTGTPSFTLKPTLPVAGASYDVYMTHHGIAGSISKDIIVSVGQLGSSGLPSTTTIFQETGGNTWEYLGRMALNPGVTVPQISFTYSSGTLAGSGSRMYADAAKFVYVAPAPSAPEIVNQPENISVKQGLNATFTVSIASNPSPISYSWRFEGAVISGANSSSYTVQNAQPANEGEYTVIVSNTSGSVTSTPALLTVYTPPSIASQPASQVIAAGDEARFEVTAGGTEPFIYQWRFESSLIQGATGPIYTIPHAVNTDAGRYSVIVSNIVGAITSSFANLTVSYPAAPEIQSARFLPGNVLELEGTGGPGLLILQGSPDMISWTNRASISTSSNSFLLQEPATNASLFYRLRRE